MIEVISRKAPTSAMAQPAQERAAFAEETVKNRMKLGLRPRELAAKLVRRYATLPGEGRCPFPVEAGPHDQTGLGIGQVVVPNSAGEHQIGWPSTEARYLAATELITCVDRHARVCVDRPFWLTHPCPSWCAGWHHDDDGGEDRVHMSAWNGMVPLVLEDGASMLGGRIHQPEHASLYLVQGAYEREPRIWCGKGESNKGWHMTSTEARELAAAIVTAVDLADGGQGATARTAA